MNGDTDIVGIDLGTTQSLVGVVEAGFPILLADERGSRMTRSVVYYGKEGAEPAVGEEAWRRRVVEGERTVVSVKRLIGRRAKEGQGDKRNDGEWRRAGNEWSVCGAKRTGPEGVGPEVLASVDGGLGVVVEGVWRSPVEISAAILRRLKRVAEAALERPVSRAVITVPAYFNDAQRQATKEAGRLAGLTVERILNEPTAAALAFGLDKLGEQSRVAIYDLGGGTFDVSILELNQGIFQVLATHGDTHLGGDDADILLARWLAECLDGEEKGREEKDFREPKQARDERRGWEGMSALERGRVLEAAVEAKHGLSVAEQVEVRLPFWREAQSFVRTVRREEFEDLIRPLVERTRGLCRRAMADAGVLPEQLGAAVLVGGSTRIPLVRKIVGEIFGREPDTSQHPDETVALGAVIQAGILSGKLQKMVLLDVTPLSLGIETFGGLMNVILPRNTTIPARAGELFTNAVTDQPGMSIRVLQGEREMAKDNWLLGEFEVDFERGPKGSARVGVQFEMDADGILKVLARDTKTGQDKLVEIRHAAVDVTEAKVEEMIAQSLDHAFEDMTERQWAEAAIKSQELLAAVAGALPEAGASLDEATRQRISDGVAEVEAALSAGELRRLKSSNAALDAATETLAAMLVERALETALARKLGMNF